MLSKSIPSFALVGRQESLMYRISLSSFYLNWPERTAILCQNQITLGIEETHLPCCAGHNGRHLRRFHNNLILLFIDLEVSLLLLRNNNKAWRF